MSSRIRRILTAKPVDLEIYRQYVINHPKHKTTAMLYRLPWSVTLILMCALGALDLACWLGSR